MNNFNYLVLRGFPQQLLNDPAAHILLGKRIKNPLKESDSLNRVENVRFVEEFEFLIIKCLKFVNRNSQTKGLNIMLFSFTKF